MQQPTPIRGRGAGDNPVNRFEALHYEPDPDTQVDGSGEPPRVATKFYVDHTKTILSKNDSPDIPFTYGVNPYRGCEHGCVYCYARPTHEFLGFSAGLDFESRIMVKTNAPALLREAFSKPKWEPQCVSMSGVTDCYQPCERQFRITRGCLGVFAEFRNPVGIVTKNHLVTRDADLLGELSAYNAAAVYVSITTLDAGLARRMEPRTSSPSMRLEAIATLTAAGVRVGVLAAPMIPGLNDHELPAILDAAGKAGAKFAGYVVLRLPYGVKDLFAEWIEREFPDRAGKVLERIRAMREGGLNRSDFASRMKGTGVFADQIRQMFHMARRKAGISEGGPNTSAAAFRRPGGRQMELF